MGTRAWELATHVSRVYSNLHAGRTSGPVPAYKGPGPGVRADRLLEIAVLNIISWQQLLYGSWVSYFITARFPPFFFFLLWASVDEDEDEDVNLNREVAFLSISFSPCSASFIFPFSSCKFSIDSQISSGLQWPPSLPFRNRVSWSLYYFPVGGYHLMIALFNLFDEINVCAWVDNRYVGVGSWIKTSFSTTL